MEDSKENSNNIYIQDRSRRNMAKLFSILPVVIVIGILGLGISSFAQEPKNDTIGSNNSYFQSQGDPGQQEQRQSSSITKPEAQIVVSAEELFELRDNLAEARVALDRGNLVELAQHIENLDQLVTVMLNPLPAGTGAFEQRGQQIQQQQSKLNADSSR